MLLSFKQEPINHSIFGIHGALILAALWTFPHETKLTATAFKTYWRYSNSFTQDRTFIILASLPTSLVSWKSVLLQLLAHDIHIYTLKMKYDNHKAISSEGIRKKNYSFDFSLYFFSGATAQRGPGPPPARGL
jgi:hypothetical protein